MFSVVKKKGYCYKQNSRNVVEKHIKQREPINISKEKNISLNSLE